MMDRMIGAKRLGLVHPAVGPIKPCVMKEEIGEQRNRHPPQRISGRIGVDSRPATLLPAPCDHPGGHAINRRRSKAPTNFALYLRAKIAVMPGAHEVGQPGKHAAGQQVAHRDNRRHRQHRNPDVGVHAGQRLAGEVDTVDTVQRALWSRGNQRFEGRCCMRPYDKPRACRTAQKRALRRLQAHRRSMAGFAHLRTFQIPAQTFA